MALGRHHHRAHCIYICIGFRPSPVSHQHVTHLGYPSERALHPGVEVPRAGIGGTARVIVAIASSHPPSLSPSPFGACNASMLSPGLTAAHFQVGGRLQEYGATEQAFVALGRGGRRCEAAADIADRIS
jgi:hypothetical protein